MAGPRRRFKVADIAQQVVGGFLLAGPFVVTEEVWVLATEMTVWQGLGAALIVFLTGYGALYKADDRDPEREEEVGGVPVRFLSLMIVSFGAVLLLALVFNAPATFFTGLEVPRSEWPYNTAKAVSIGAIFSVVGAATADSVF
jgi:uncharacterized membrane protein